MKTLYSTTVTTVGGRDGHVESADGLLKLNLALPKALGGNETATNPEQLFAAGYAACFEGAIRFLGRQQKLPLTAASVTATVRLLDGGSSGFKLDVDLTVTVEGLEQAAAEKLVRDADAVCPYSKAIRGNVSVAITVNAN